MTIDHDYRCSLIHRLAVMQVCPLLDKPFTPYEMREVARLTAFGIAVVNAVMLAEKRYDAVDQEWCLPTNLDY